MDGSFVWGANNKVHGILFGFDHLIHNIQLFSFLFLVYLLFFSSFVSFAMKLVAIGLVDLIHRYMNEVWCMDEYK